MLMEHVTTLTISPKKLHITVQAATVLTPYKRLASLLLPSHYTKCVSDGVVLKSYNLVIITQEDIQPPVCHVPLLYPDENGNNKILFTCETDTLDGITQSLTIHNVSGQTISESQTRVQKAVTVNEFINTTNVCCYLEFAELGETRECIFPSSAAIHQKTDGIDREFECDFDEHDLWDDYKIGWRLLDSDYKEVVLTGRDWIRGGGRYLLILEITEDDVGRMVECRVYQSNHLATVVAVGFAVISDHVVLDHTTHRGNGTDSWSTATPMTNVVENLFMILSIVFAVLWIVTITLPVVWYKCTKRKTKEGNSSAPNYSTVIYKDSRAPAPFPAGNSAADTKDATYYYHTIKGGAVDMDEDGYLVLTGDMGGGVLGDNGGEAKSSQKSRERDVDEDEDGYLVVLQDSRDGSGGNGGRDAQGEVKCNEYMEMSGSQGQVEYEWMKSLTYENCAK